MRRALRVILRESRRTCRRFKTIIESLLFQPQIPHRESVREIPPRRLHSRIEPREQFRSYSGAERRPFRASQKQ